MQKLFLLMAIIFIGYNVYTQSKPFFSHNIEPTSIRKVIPTKHIAPSPTLKIPDIKKVLANDYQVFQTFNNCGPAALSMALSYFDIHVTQKDLGDSLRPYQIPNGDNDDKSVTLDEMADEAKKYHLIPFHRPNGESAVIKKFITYDIPVITRTLLTKDDDIGHYRVIKGYDDVKGEFIQDDSMRGHNISYSYDDFNLMWKHFNYEYLVLIPPEKEEIAKKILGTDADFKTSWEKAAKQSQSQLTDNPSDIFARFNLSVALYNIGEYEKSVAEFEKVQDKLPSRTLWYQIEPIEEYYEVGNYERVMAISDQILNHDNRAYSELYFLRGQIFLKQSRPDLAQQEFEKAVYYNRNYLEKIPK